MQMNFTRAFRIAVVAVAASLLVRAIGRLRAKRKNEEEK
jgi:hypothetical protein